MKTDHGLAPTEADIERVALDALTALPEPFQAPAAAVGLRVVDFAPDDILRDLDIDDPFTLTGLYDGIPMTEKSVAHQPEKPDVIWLFRRPILDEWIARGDVDFRDLVAHVFIHELAHHFGWSDEDIATIDRWWE